MNDEAEQLRHYAASGSEDAFAALVQHYAPLVYQAARRRLGGDAHRAEDVTQAVFVALARNARSLTGHPDLTGWLFVTTRFLAASTLRTEQRRHAREEAASREQEIMKDDTPDNTGALPEVLDDALMELRQIDRQIILLRFHRGLRMAEIGTQLGLTENATQKRIDRALERLRERLAHRGITSTATALTVAFAQQTAVAMPAGLAAAATTAGISCGVGTGSLLFASGFMAVSKLQVGIAAALIVAATTGVVWEVRENTQLRADVAGQSVAADAAIMGLQQQVAALQQRTAAAEADTAKVQQALQAARAARPPASRVLASNRDRVQAAIRRASELQREGRLQQALAELMVCYREVADTVEKQLLASSLASLGRAYPPALDELRALRDDAIERFKEGSQESELVIEIGQLNERLKDSANTIALYDSLPEKHAARQGLALLAFNALIEARRYEDALVGKPYGSMLNDFVRMTRSSGSADRAVMGNSALANIEVLAGVGRLADAQTLADQWLAVDGSEATRAAIQQRMDRARAASAPAAGRVAPSP